MARHRVIHFLHVASRLVRTLPQDARGGGGGGIGVRCSSLRAQILLPWARTCRALDRRVSAQRRGPDDAWAHLRRARPQLAGRIFGCRAVVNGQTDVGGRMGVRRGGASSGDRDLVRLEDSARLRGAAGAAHPGAPGGRGASALWTLKRLRSARRERLSAGAGNARPWEWRQDTSGSCFRSLSAVY